MVYYDFNVGCYLKGFEHSGLHLRHGVGSELAFKSQLVQFLRHGRVLDHGYPVGVLSVSRHRETVLHSVDHAG